MPNVSLYKFQVLARSSKQKTVHVSCLKRKDVRVSIGFKQKDANVRRGVDLKLGQVS